MAIVAGDIKFYLSGGGSNTDPDASLGGVISTTEVVDATIENLFDSNSSVESLAGETAYRCIYVKNTHGSLTLTAVATWISSNTPSTDSTIDIGVGTSAVSATEQTVANETTAPSAVSFSAPSTLGTGLAIADLTPADTMAIWIRKTVSAAATAYATDGATINVGGDTTA